jgi:2-oxoglutarate dehydrogenase E2 component (dihydrolipoamide succinyltransferase)
MKYDMVMPKMGESITEGTIIKWLKNIGDTVEKDEIILEISTDKVDSEIPTPVAGKIAELLVSEGDTVEVGKTIAKIETDTKQATVEDSSPPTTKQQEIIQEQVKKPSEGHQTELPAMQKNTQTSAGSLEKSKSGRFYSPVVLNIARTEGISREELEKIAGTGINGRVTKKDVLNHLESRRAKKPAPQVQAPVEVPQPGAVANTPSFTSDGIEIIPMDHIRKKIADHMVQTVHTSPHVGLFIEVDMSNVVAIRQRSKDAFFKKEGLKLTYMPFICEAVTKTLKEFPYVNSSIDHENIILKHYVNLGIAVASDQGLIVPVIKNADSMNLVGLARAISDLAIRTRTKKLKPDEVTGGTFSISNFGVYGTTIGFPLINQPQTAILGVGALEKRPVVVNDAIAIHSMMNISLSFDHRIIDGALGAQFLQRVKQHLENYDSSMTF